MSLYKRVKKQGLCPRDMNHEVELYRRELKSVTPGDMTAGSDFSLIGRLFCGVETVSITQGAKAQNRSGGVQKGYEENATHFFYFHYSDTLKKLEPSEIFIKFRGEYYRCLGFENLNQLNRVIIINARLRGDTEKNEART